MSQGKVIAVKPLGIKVMAELNDVDSTESDVSISDAKDVDLAGNLVFIVHDDNSLGSTRWKSVVCYVDKNSEFSELDPVEFNFTSSRTRPIREVINVSKSKG